MGLFETARVTIESGAEAGQLITAHMYLNLAAARSHPNAPDALQELTGLMHSEDVQTAQGSTGPAATSTLDPFAPRPGGPCFTIQHVDLQGAEAVGAEPAGYRDLLGTCATAADIAAVLSEINEHYQYLGCISTRAYVPEQALTDGSLVIRIIPGRIEGYVYCDGRQADAWVNTAFPGERGDLLSLRDLEQALDNINGPRSPKGNSS